MAANNFQSLQEYLEWLEEQRNELSIQIAGVRTALGLAREDGITIVGLPAPGNRPERQAGATGQIRSDQFFKMSIPEAIKAYLEIMKKPQGPKDIAEGLKSGGVLTEAKNFYANIMTALKRLRESGGVVNTKTGGWGLAEWYAGRSGAATPEKPKAKKKKSTSKVKKVKVKTSKKGKLTKSTSPVGGYRAFVGQQMKAGMTMKEAAEAWKKQKQG